jgi:ADP-heptose:LPS heptosyltransferase
VKKDCSSGGDRLVHVANGTGNGQGFLPLTQVKKIAILRALNLGDLLCAIPAFRSIRQGLPEADVSLIGLPWAEDFVKRFNHLIDRFIPFPGYPGFPEQPDNVRRFPAFLQMMQEARFDLAIQMQGSGTVSNSLVKLFGADWNVGFRLPGQYAPDDRFFILYPSTEHEIHKLLRLVRHLGMPPTSDALEFPLFDEDRHRWEDLTSTHNIQRQGYACIHPGSRAPSRRWNPSGFAVLGDHLYRQGLQVVLTGEEKELPITERVAELMAAPVINLTGKSDLGALAMLLKHARLLVSNDTGVSHLAAALETPSIVLFTVTQPHIWGPLNHSLHHAIPNASELTGESVVDLIDQILVEEGV